MLECYSSEVVSAPIFHHGCLDVVLLTVCKDCGTFWEIYAFSKYQLS